MSKMYELYEATLWNAVCGSGLYQDNLLPKCREIISEVYDISLETIEKIEEKHINHIYNDYLNDVHLSDNDRWNKFKYRLEKALLEVRIEINNEIYLANNKTALKAELALIELETQEMLQQ